MRLKNLKKIEKPWGYELLVDHNSSYALKEIVMKAGTRSSLQLHQKKLETIYVLSGRIEVEWDGAHGVGKEIFKEGEAYHVPSNTKHRVTVLDDSRLIEVSTPELDDIIRFQDDFGRK